MPITEIYDLFVAPSQVSEFGGPNGGSYTSIGFPISAPATASQCSYGFQVEGHGGTNFLGFNFTAVLSSFWFHCFQNITTSFTDGSSVNDEMIVFRNGTTPLFRVARGATAGHYKLQYWDGAAWQIAGSEITTPIWSVGKQIDIQIVMSDTVGVLRLYINQALAAEFTGDTIRTAATNIDNLQVFGYRTNVSNRETNYCEMLLADDDTRNVYVDEKASGTTANINEWIGSPGNIQNVPFTSTTFVTSDTAGQRTTRNFGTVDTVSVVKVICFATARGTVGNPFDLDMIIRDSGIDYLSDSGPVSLTLDWAQYRFDFDTDPVLAGAWTTGNIADNYQYGLISVA